MNLPRAIHGRPRGFIEWKPQAKTAQLIDQVTGILDEYRAYLPMTIRQIFYRLVGVYGYEKTEKGYARLCETLNRARRAQIIPFDSIRDDGFHRSGFLGWSDIEAAKCYLRNLAGQYRLDRQTGQETRLVVWCEAGGMTQQLESVCGNYSVPVFSSGGFDSVTVKYMIAEEFADMEDVTVLHIGDHDPSGVHVFGSLDEDVRAFLNDLGGDANFIRLAVLPDHVTRYNLPTAPPKRTDRRNFEGWTVQAEALPPDVLAQILEQAIVDHLDMEVYRQAVETEAEDRRRLKEWLSGGAE